MYENLVPFIEYKITDGPLSIIKIQALHGANYFSAGQVICLRINLGDYDEVYSNDIEGLLEFLQEKLPFLHDHYCSPGIPGGFFKRVKEGTLLGHIIEHVAIELQTRAGMDVGYGKTRSTPEKGIYNVIFRFLDELAGTYAAKAAVNMINAKLLNQDFDVNQIINNLIDIREKRLLGPSTQAIVNEVEKRKIPFQRLDTYNLVQIGTGKYQKRIRATITSDTGFIAVETAGNKVLTSIMLIDAGVPAPLNYACNDIEDVLNLRNTLGKALVIKSANPTNNKYISKNLVTEQELSTAFAHAIKGNKKVLVQEYFEGSQYRMLVIDYKFAAASLLTSPFIIGNGTDTIQVLINKFNAQAERQKGDKGPLSKVEIDEPTIHILTRLNYTLDTVLKPNEKIFLKNSGNMRSGGSATDVTDIVHPSNKFMAERAARAIGLNVAGIDVISKDITVPFLSNNAVVIDVKAAPDFRMHLNPTLNKPRNVAKEVVNMLFPPLSKNRIPVFSITGTAGKSIAAFLLNYCIGKEGYSVGLTSTEGLYITDKLLMKGNMTEPENVSLVFKDPTIDCAVLETSLEGIIRRGLGYKFADYGIILNIMDDHIGNDDIEFIEDIAYVKSVVAEEVFTSGYTILNADSGFTQEMLERIYSKPALFSTQKNENILLQQHILKGGLAVTIENEIIRVYYNNQNFDLISVNEIPLFFNGKAMFMSDAILAVVAALTAFGVHPDKISKNLAAFVPHYKNLPGRMNLYEAENYSILLDYAHNKPSFIALNTFLKHYKLFKIGIFDAPGDRSDAEIIELGSLAAGMFDEVIIYDGIDNRGRTKGEVSTLLHTGLLNAQFDVSKIHIADDHQNALEHISKFALNKNFIILLSAESILCYEFLQKNNLIKTS